MGKPEVPVTAVTEISEEAITPTLESPKTTGHFNHPPEERNFIPSDQPKWVSHSWRSFSIIYALLFIGIAGALSHHFLYASLVGKEASGQVKYVRAGTALSYLTKASLVAAVLVAYRQQVWATCSRKALSISAIDSLFSAGTDPFGLANLEIFSKAKIAVFLAAIAWLTPLAVILTPATLAVELALMNNETVCSSVRTINSDAEATNNWRDGAKLSGMLTLSLSLWNTTGLDPNDPNTFDYYTGPSPALSQTALLSTYLQKVISNQSIAGDVCGTGWNCSYTLNFIAPGYQCTERASGRNENATQLTDIGAPFDTNYLLPDGKYGYYAQTSLGDYAPIQIDAGDAGIPVQKPPYPKNLGAFRTEPLLWIGQSVLAPGNATLPHNSSDPRWTDAFVPKIYSCEHHLTNYTVLFNYTLNQQNTTVLKREYMGPIINTTYAHGVLSNDGTKDNTTANPASAYVFPQDVENYRMVGAYHSLGSVLRSFINGTINLSNTITPIASTSAVGTTLIDRHSYLPVSDRVDQIQGLYENMIISLISNPQFLSVAWAADPKKESTIGANTGPEATYPCVKSRYYNQFVYRAWQLWVVYGISILISIVAVLLGTVAIVQNEGHMHDMRFSTIVQASRTRNLDDLPWRNGVGGVADDEVLSARLQYGLLRENGLEKSEIGMGAYVGFGREGDVACSLGRESGAKRVLSFKPMRTYSH
ncbi:hypothetical protein BT63DRAFT_180532 [Microthyrium microscopicum]|uniref:Formylmethionine deformylase-like protein n=1 Tax=Microthyrium microscopicum TaxID=703497 RepID=A0A6A6UK09_9PEZI|nr:hypothetical protein BT63DRAFT_180532 [Microthyrium microscopicum]